MEGFHLHYCTPSSKHFYILVLGNLNTYLKIKEEGIRHQGTMETDFIGKENGGMSQLNTQKRVMGLGKVNIDLWKENYA